jgi:hypothetical protein
MQTGSASIFRATACSDTGSNAKTQHVITMQNPIKQIKVTAEEIKLSEKDIARFWAKVNKDGPTMPHMESACWVWTATKGKGGYGSFGAAGKVRAAHRIAWIAAKGQIPHDGSYHGIEVCHRCDQRDCVNPNHLFLGTHANNMEDMKLKSRGNQPCGDNHHSRLRPERMARGTRHGSRTHPERVARGEAHSQAKLTVAQVMKIRSLYATGGITLKQLGVQFGISQTYSSEIINRKVWRHI